MFQFFNFIVEILKIAINMVVRILEMLVFIFTSAFKAVAWLIAILAYVPGEITALILVPISLAVVFQVLNKGE